MTFRGSRPCVAPTRPRAPAGTKCNTRRRATTVHRFHHALCLHLPNEKRPALPDELLLEHDQAIVSVTHRLNERRKAAMYDFDSDVVRVEAAQNLRNLAASLGKYPNTNLLIVGHTDAVGTSDYNQALSQRRATAAANYLGSQGVSSQRLQAVGRGETEPLAANDTEAGRQLNRRVEIAIFADASARNP